MNDERITRLEQNVKTQRLAILFLSLTLCGFLSIAATSHKNGFFDTIQANSVIIKNDRGKNAVVITSDTEGDGTLTTFRRSGMELVHISATVDGKGTVTTYGKQGRKLVELNATVEEDGMITTYKSTGKKLVDLGATVDGGAIFMFNKTGEGIITLQPDEYGNGQVGVWNRKGKGRVFDSQ